MSSFHQASCDWQVKNLVRSMKIMDMCPWLHFLGYEMMSMVRGDGVSRYHNIDKAFCNFVPRMLVLIEVLGMERNSYLEFVPKLLLGQRVTLFRKGGVQWYQHFNRFPGFLWMVPYPELRVGFWSWQVRPSALAQPDQYWWGEDHDAETMSGLHPCCDAPFYMKLLSKP